MLQAITNIAEQNCNLMIIINTINPILFFEKRCINLKNEENVLG